MKWLARFAVVAAGIYVIYYFAFPTYTHRFRLTFQVEIDGQVKEGMGVITVRDYDGRWVPLSQTDWTRAAFGPSPWIDLGERGMVIAAMRPHRADYQPKPQFAANLSFLAYLGRKSGSMGINSDSVRSIRSQQGIRQLADDQMPEFIWLSKPLDPASAIVMPPMMFSKIIGGNIRFVGASVEITADLSDGSLIEKLPWLRVMMDEEISSGRRTIPARFTVGPYNLIGDLW